MSTNKNNTVLIIASAILIGVAGYFSVKAYRKKHPKNTVEAPDPVVDPLSTANQIDLTKPLITENGKPTTKPTTKPPVTNPNSNGGQSSSSSSSIPSDTLKQIDIIVQNGKGVKASHTYLESSYQNNPSGYKIFISRWATAIQKRLADRNKKAFVGGTTFMYGNMIYDSYQGLKRLDNSPIDKMATTTSEGSAMRQYPMQDSSVTSKIGKNIILGQIKAYFYNDKDDKLYFFIGDPLQQNSVWIKDDYKWVWASYVKF